MPLWMKRLSLFVAIFLIFIVAACDTTLEKPTSKEDASAALEKKEMEANENKSSDANDNHTKDETSNQTACEQATAKDTIVLSIVISDSEIPLPPTEVEIEEGDTVLDVLIKMTKREKIQMDYRGGRGATAYVEGIDNVYEFDRGQGSGWMYRVNGVFPDRGVGVVPLLPGDCVEWLYTTDLGQDLGADLEPFRR